MRAGANPNRQYTDEEFAAVMGWVTETMDAKIDEARELAATQAAVEPAPEAPEATAPEAPAAGETDPAVVTPTTEELIVQ